MKFCYVDESGTGDEDYAVMVGVVVDALRMRPTKAGWDIVLTELSRLAGRTIDELHTRDFYSGNSPWTTVKGDVRSQIIDIILEWLNDRKHLVVFATVDKRTWHKTFPADARHADVGTIWRFLALHVVLQIQKHGQRHEKNKGNTVLIFDNEEREKKQFTDLVLRPPSWTDSYYTREKKQDPLDQIVDAPYFADSRDVPLLQAADFIAYFLRRHLELAGGAPERYSGEQAKVANWADKALRSKVDTAISYPKKQRCKCAELFYSYAPIALRS